jgi:hypothetical protein
LPSTTLAPGDGASRPTTTSRSVLLPQPRAGLDEIVDVDEIVQPA